MRVWLWLLGAFVIWLFFLWLLIAGKVYAHDAPSGWTYDYRCCNVTDCRPADGPDGPRHHPIQILEVQGGYRVVKPSGKFDTIEWNSPKVRPSKDGEYHVCTHGGSNETGTICIYIPDKGV